MLLEIVKNHDLIYDSFDLGSAFTLVITIEGDYAMITDSNARMWSEQIKKEEIGKYIAETILLQGLSADKVDFGSFTTNRSLPSLEDINRYNEDNFYFDTEFLKLWTLARVACNSDFKDKIVEISYYAESGTTTYNIYTKEEYKKYYKENEDFLKGQGE